MKDNFNYPYFNKNKLSAFKKSKCDVQKKLNNFSKYVPRQSIARFVTLFEIFKLQKNIKGSIVECGVHHGGSLMAFAKISSILEPYNFNRKIIGFDTFKGFLGLDKKDKMVVKKYPLIKKGLFSEDYSIYEEIISCVEEYDENRFLNHINKIELIKGDANKTIPLYLKKNKHLLISLLFMDFDIYKPTSTALKFFLPRMAKGSILCFDEINNSMWPGETIALLEKINCKNYEIKSFEYEPNISYIVI
jgi:hypothetical protein